MPDVIVEPELTVQVKSPVLSSCQPHLGDAGLMRSSKLQSIEPLGIFVGTTGVVDIGAAGLAFDGVTVWGNNKRHKQSILFKIKEWP